MLVYASGSGSWVSTVWPSAFTAVRATPTVCCHAASSTTPIPSGEGQMSLFTSLTCQSWWLAPSVDPAATTRSRHCSTLSRQYAQPSSEPARNRTVWSW
ncbi:hypothetical protein BJF78_09085 [Pseudonocardia sp. CNS-139]|nr:hypothetical protein BJF78_09085 [Pseudonocardia sp. CNS-139]